MPRRGPAQRRPGHAAKYFTEANNSLHETLAAVDLSAAVGALGGAEAAAMQGLGVRVKRMLRALMG